MALSALLVLFSITEISSCSTSWFTFLCHIVDTEIFCCSDYGEHSCIYLSVGPFGVRTGETLQSNFLYYWLSRYLNRYYKLNSIYFFLKLKPIHFYTYSFLNSIHFLLFQFHTVNIKPRIERYVGPLYTFGDLSNHQSSELNV